MKENRPWGEFEVLFSAPNLKFKIMRILPGQRTSLQTHKYRDENLYINKGPVSIQIDQETREYFSEEKCLIERGIIHRIENKSDSIVEIIEIQAGIVVDENDIERIEDDYNREKK